MTISHRSNVEYEILRVSIRRLHRNGRVRSAWGLFFEYGPSYCKILVFRNVGILFLVSGFEVFEARSVCVPSVILGARSLISPPAWVGRMVSPHTTESAEHGRCHAGLIAKRTTMPSTDITVPVHDTTWSQLPVPLPLLLRFCLLYTSDAADD